MRRVYLSCAHSCGTWRPSGSRLLLSLVLNYASAVEHAARSGLYCRLLLKPSATANCRARRRSTRNSMSLRWCRHSPLKTARYRGIPQISLCLHVRNLSVEAPFLPLVSEGFFGVSFLKCAASPLHGQQMPRSESKADLGPSDYGYCLPAARSLSHCSAAGGIALNRRDRAPC